MMKKSLLAMALLAVSQPLWAQVQGTVRDEQGLPIGSASIEVVGTNLKISSDAQGNFSLPKQLNDHVELHIEAPGFTHKTLHLHPGDKAINLTLNNSSMEIVKVIGLPWHASNMESAQPVTVLGGDALRDRQASTLGETLKHEVGVHSSYYGPVASSPIIRGLEGPRVLVTQNGLDAGDASRVGPDHAVATEASTARQIEILRGPATLFYGSGAIGGVVNVVDDRVPQSADSYGEWRIERDSVANDRLLSASGNSGLELDGAVDLGLHLDGFWRAADNYQIPGPAAVETEEEHEEEHHETHSDRLENSWSEAQGVNLGSSFILQEGFVGLAYGLLERQYGIPGHAPHEDEGGAEEANVYADVTQHRLQLLSELNLEHDFFSASNSRFGFTDYQHSEIEKGAVGTTFRNNTAEGRWELFHHPIAEWRGALSLHYKHSDFEAIGEEAFTPPSQTGTLALGLMEERHFGDLLVQLGARIEQVELSANQLLGVHSDHVSPADQPGQDFDQQSKPLSASAGLVWDFTPGYNIGLSLTHAERAPAAAELLAYGPHLGSGLYEIGALFELHQEDDGHFHVDLKPGDVALETSNNLDISLRKFEGDVGFILNGFYNRIDNYYYLSETGLTAEALEEEHEQADEDQDEHAEHGAELPLFIYQARDAELYGFESEIVWQINTPLTLSLTGDYTRASLRASSATAADSNLPRIPPLRIGARLNYELNQWQAELSSQRYLAQNRTGALETRTAAYTLVDAQLSYALSDAFKLYLKGNNLTNEYARVHASFLKDQAPLPARSLALGISGRF